MVTEKLRRSLIWGGGFLFCILVICGLLVYSKSQTGRGSEITGYPVYISDLFVSGSEVFMLRTRDESSIPREYDVYRVSKDGQEQYVQPYPGKAAHWNRDTGKLYFLSGMEICEFDPVTGQCRSYAVEQAYEKICAVEGEYIFLQQELYGPVYMYLATTGKESMLGASGWVLDVYDGYLLTWDIYRNCLTCYSYHKDQTVWTIDLSESFSSAPVLCVSNGDLYLAGRERGNIYRIPRFTEKSELEMLEISAHVIGMVDAHDYVLYATTDGRTIRFHALFLDGTHKKLAEWEEVNYYQDASLIMVVHEGKLYCTLKTEENLFSCDLKE